MRQQIISWPAECCAITLDQAWYCESCVAIVNDPTCCLCTSADHTQRLDPWLNRELEPISIPLTGVILSVTPAPRKPPAEAKSTPLPQLVPLAS